MDSQISRVSASTFSAPPNAITNNEIKNSKAGRYTPEQGCKEYSQRALSERVMKNIKSVFLPSIKENDEYCHCLADKLFVFLSGKDVPEDRKKIYIDASNTIQTLKEEFESAPGNTIFRLDICDYKVLFGNESYTNHHSFIIEKIVDEYRLHHRDVRKFNYSDWLSGSPKCSSIYSGSSTFSTEQLHLDFLKKLNEIMISIELNEDCLEINRLTHSLFSLSFWDQGMVDRGKRSKPFLLLCKSQIRNDFST